MLLHLCHLRLTLPRRVLSTIRTPPFAAAITPTCRFSRDTAKSQCPTCPSVDLKYDVPAPDQITASINACARESMQQPAINRRAITQCCAVAAIMAGGTPGRFKEPQPARRQILQAHVCNQAKDTCLQSPWRTRAHFEGWRGRAAHAAIGLFPRMQHLY